MTRLIKINRQFSVMDTYINYDLISSIYQEMNNDINKLTYYVVMNTGIFYDINDETFRRLTAGVLKVNDK